MFAVGIFYKYFVTDDLSNRTSTKQSTTYMNHESAYGSNNAVDKNIRTCMRTKEIGNASPEKTTWWQVDLGKVYSIYSISIFFKNYDKYGIRVHFE